MVFSSLTFLFIYLPIVLVVMKLSPLKLRNFSLFIVSLIFYGWGEPVYILIMLFSTVFDYFNGYMVDKYHNQRNIAKRFVILSIFGNLSILGFFKYFDFFATNLNALGINFIEPLGIALPIGISFYTFQTMSYPIDVYRNDASVQKNMVSFGAYVTMFPQLIAGPIVRFKDIAEQLDHRVLSNDKFADGVKRFVVGLAKKVLLANNIGLLWDTILRNPTNSVLTSWLGIIAFSFQIYFDFSGYSDMAIGLGKMLGFEFLENFNYPYISKSITDFWRRWHISLSTWFRDYVYIPLGGNRKGIKRQILNICIVWFLTGFWHGASWNYILWGVYFGTILIIEKLFVLKWLEKTPTVFKHIYALFFIIIGWVIFAIEDLGKMSQYFMNMFGLNGNAFIDNATLFYLRDNIGLLFILVIASLPIGKTVYHKYIENRKVEWISVILITLGLFISVAYLVDATYNPFLYFRF